MWNAWIHLWARNDLEMMHANDTLYNRMHSFIQLDEIQTNDI